MSAATNYNSGLEGVVAAQTRLSHVDGRKGELILCGYAIEEIAPRATFEEVVYLLRYDRLPDAGELAGLRQALACHRSLPRATLDLLCASAGEKAPVMDALRMAAGTLDLELPADARAGDGLALAILARIPAAIAAYWRLRQGLAPVTPDATLGHAANYLYTLSGERPSAAATRGLETYLNTIADHGLNASTFTCRVIIATQSDLVSAVTGAIGALKGPLHGGAPGPALDMVFEIGEAARAEAYLRDKLARGERLMGFGHRIYKVRDPRAEVLGEAAHTFFTAQESAAEKSAAEKSAAEAFAGGEDKRKLYELATAVEETAVRLLAEYKPGRNLQTNVEFYTALLLHGLGLPAELFTPTFAAGRAAGWIAHAQEQLATGRLIRPASEYVGAVGRTWVAVDVCDAE